MQTTQPVSTKSRPKLLTVLCILSFAGIAISLIGYFNSYYQYVEMQALNASSFIVMAGFELIILAGVVLMWKLRKTGFYIYLSVKLISLAYPFLTGTADTVLGIFVLPAIILGIAFIILYASQLKYMS